MPPHRDLAHRAQSSKRQVDHQEPDKNGERGVQRLSGRHRQRGAPAIADIIDAHLDVVVDDAVAIVFRVQGDKLVVVIRQVQVFQRNEATAARWLRRAIG